MTNISKKQLSLTLVAVVFATALISSALVVDSVDATKSKNNRQTIAQVCNQNQQSSVVTAGANSPVLNSGNNAGSMH